MGNLEKGMMPDQEVMPTPETKDGPFEQLRAAIKGKFAKPEDKDVVENSVE